MNDFWDEKAKDLDDLKEWWKEDQLQECPGYGNHHEWFAITNIPKRAFTDVIRVLKDAEENDKSCSYDTFFYEGKNGSLVLECNTAKDFEGELLSSVLDAVRINSLHHECNCVTYWQDCWDFPDDCTIDSEKCEITNLEVFPYDFESEGWSKWDVRFAVRDNATGAEFDFGGGCLEPDQALSLLGTARSLQKADGYSEDISPDVGHLYDSDMEIDEEEY